MSIIQAIILGFIQGVTELFPISSLGHSVILPNILGWHLRQHDPYFIVFLVATHMATAIVLVGFFWHDWVQIVRGLVRSFVAREIRADDTYARLGWLLVAATVPAGVIGLLLQEPLSALFASPRLAAFFLIINGVILLTAERLRHPKRQPRLAPADQRIARLDIRHALFIGLAQTGALIPGISRSGASMAGGLVAGLDNESAARFSFLLATPIIAAAGVLKLPELFHPAALPHLPATLLGAACAGLAAYLSIRFLTKYFETKRLTAYGYYCLAAGVLFSVILLFR